MGEGTERRGGELREGRHQFTEPWVSESASTDGNGVLFILTLQVGINTYIVLIKTFCKSKLLDRVFALTKWSPRLSLQRSFCMSQRTFLPCPANEAKHLKMCCHGGKATASAAGLMPHVRISQISGYEYWLVRICR